MSGGDLFLGYLLGSSLENKEENKTPYEMVKIKVTYTKEDFTFLLITRLAGVIAIGIATWWGMSYMGDKLESLPFMNVALMIMPILICLAFIIELCFKHGDIGETTYKLKKKYIYGEESK